MSSHRDGNVSTTFMKRIFGFSMASWVNCLISLISTPITTALFLPEELGKINLFLSITNLLIPFIYLGFDQAYVRFHNEPCGKNSADSIFKICFAISTFMSILVGAVVLIGWRYFSSQIIGYESISVALSLIVYLIATMLMRFANLKARMENNVWLFFIQSVLSTVIIKLSFVGVALFTRSAEYAIIVRTILLALAGIVFIVMIFVKNNEVRTDYTKPVIRELSAFALPVFPTVFLIMLNTSLSQLLLKTFADYSMIGIYSNAVTIAGIITIVQSGLNTFWTPFVYENYKNQYMIQKMHHIISFAMLAVTIIISGFQDIIYYILVDEQYWASKCILGFLLISPVSDTISETLGLGIELSKKTYLRLPVYIVNILVNIVACTLLIPRFGILGAAMATALASLSMLVVKTIMGERFYKCSNNYIKLILGYIILIISAFANYTFNVWWMKIVVAFGGLVLTSLLYLKEVLFLTAKLKSLLYALGRKKV